MIKNRKLFIILCVSLVVVLIAAFVIFGLRVRKISVVYVDSTVAKNSSQNEIIRDVESIMNKNVLVLKDEEVSSLITNPYVEVLNVETVFPSSIVIQVQERIEEYYILYNGDFYVLDASLRVLRKAAGIVSSDGKNEELIEIKVDEDNISKIEIGEIVTFDNSVSNTYHKTFESLIDLFGRAGYTNLEYRRLISSIRINEHKELTVDFKNKTMLDGLKMSFVIAQIDVDAFDKIHTALSVFSELSDMERINGTIYVNGAKVNGTYQAVYNAGN